MSRPTKPLYLRRAMSLTESSAEDEGTRTSTLDRARRGRITVVLVDDHSMIRSGFRLLLEAARDIEIVAEAGDGDEAVECVREHKPDVVLMDVTMPSMDGIAATRAIKDASPATRVLILTMHADDVYVRQCLKAGACGYALKNAANLDLAHAIRAVAHGGAFFSSDIAALLREGYLTAGEHPVEDNLALLTDRERDVLRFIAEGLSNRDIAKQLDLSVNTVDSHRKHLMEKLGLHNTAEIVRFAVRKGLVS
jgi:two-component system response regulator NreC